jgi:hypothetical protein
MKKLIIAILVVSMSITTVVAQTDQGTVSLGLFDILELTNVNNIIRMPGAQNQGKTQTYNLTFAPIGSYFVADNFALGILPTYRIRFEGGNGYDETNRNLSISGFMRYYLGNGKFKTYGHIGYGMQQLKRKTEMTDAYVDPYYPSKREWFGSSDYVNLGVGAVYFFSKYFSADAMIFYSGSKTNMNYKTNSELNELLKYALQERELSLKLSLVYYFGMTKD